MRRILPLALLVVGLVALAVRSAPVGAGPAAEAGSRLVTLFRYDPLRSSISLTTGEEGRVFVDDYARQRGGDLDFGNFNADALTIGLESGRRGVLVDLGSTSDLARRFGYVEPTSGGQGYASIHYVGGRLMITRAVEGTFQPIPEGPSLLTGPTEAATARAAVGHVYLLRLVDAREPAFERIAKLLVVAHTPNESVTLRYDLLTR